MADDLGDEWWLNQEGQKKDVVCNESEDPKTESQQEDQPDQTSKQAEDAEHGQKRKLEDSDSAIKVNEVVPRKRKKKKKKNLTEHLAADGDNPGTPHNLQVAMATYFHKKLSAVEMEELLIDEDRFIENNTGSEAISEYLSRRVPEWGQWMNEERNNPTPNKSCLILVISPSAKRAVDLHHHAKAFKGDCRTAKLFAKHFNISDQAKFLASRRCQFAIGTPHRVTCLLESGALNLNATKLVILDWNRRDVKQLRMADMPELKRDLFELLRKHLIPMANKVGFKFGLF